MNCVFATKWIMHLTVLWGTKKDETIETFLTINKG